MEKALQHRLGDIPSQRISSISDLPDPSLPVFQYREYERLDFEHVLSHPSTSLANAYIIRKALTRKHYLSSTVAHWVSKHPDSVLRSHVKPAFNFELDYAEFLDDALLELYELRESLAKNEERPNSEKEWWILKPGMSDRGQGIRLFNSEDQLRQIFEEWEVEEPDEEDEDGDEGKYGPAHDGHDDDDDDDDDDGNAVNDSKNGVIVSQLRHFIVQPYIDPPLLLPSSSNRKFHIRTYVVATGSLKVYVFKEMLALFAAKPYQPPSTTTNEDGVENEDILANLARHLSNTCFQEGGSANEGTVRRFWSLDDNVPGLGASASAASNSNSNSNWKENVFGQICAISGELFEAAARGMMIHFQTIPNAFEVFGVDFLVDCEGTAWLLEVNAFPDFAQTGEELKEVVVGGLFGEVVDVAVKPFFGLGSQGLGGSELLRLVADVPLGRK